MAGIADYLKTTFVGKQIWIVGVGREGLSTYQLLRSHLPNTSITLIDDKTVETLGNQLTNILATDSNAQFYQSDEVTREGLTNSDKVIAFKTPGIPHSQKIIELLHQSNISITSNTQLFFELLEQLPRKPKTIGVTGTKGKSTTTSLIFHVLNANSVPSLLAGNIGTPPLSLVEQLTSQENTQYTVVLELSSHQLQDLTISPDIAVIQNITAEHLDYYPSFDIYQNAKQSITKYQNEKQYVIYSPRFDTVVNILRQSQAQQKTFDVEPKTTEKLTAYATEQAIFYGDEKIIDTTDIPLMGKHNLFNTLPAVIVGKMLGLTPTQIAQAIKNFSPLPHRLEFVAEVDGVRYYNDSQATTPESVAAALTGFPNKTVHLIAGGSDKGLDLEPLATTILAADVASVALFPPMGEVIAQHIEELDREKVKLHHVENMAEAVQFVSQQAKSGDVVLLSPGCASFGIFKSYQDRGDQFKEEVGRLI